MAMLAWRSLVRWLRPEFQNPQGTGQTALDTGEETATVAAPAKLEKVDWPKTMADQAKAVRAALVARGEVLTAEQLARGFKGARVERVAALLEAWTSLGQAREVSEGCYAGQQEDGMQHWLTVHHPPEEGRQDKPGESGIWVKSHLASCFEDMKQGDLVLIYQTKSGPKRWLQEADGSRRRSKYGPGFGGVVLSGRVDKVTPNHPITRAIQDDGDEVDWARLAVLCVELLPRPVPLVEVTAALGWNPRARMRGFGGLMRITGAQFRAIAGTAGL